MTVPVGTVFRNIQRRIYPPWRKTAKLSVASSKSHRLPGFRTHRQPANHGKTFGCQQRCHCRPSNGRVGRRERTICRPTYQRVFNACEMTSWALAAHIVVQPSHRALPAYDYPVIDLTSGDLGGLLAWTYHFMRPSFDKVDPEISPSAP